MGEKGIVLLYVRTKKESQYILMFRLPLVAAAVTAERSDLKFCWFRGTTLAMSQLAQG